MKSIRHQQGAVSALTAILIALVIVFAGAAGYFYVAAPSSGSTVTSTVVSTTTISQSSTTNSQSVSTSQYTALEQLSKQEGGQVTFYSTLDASDWSTYFAPKLKLAFPWINVNFVGVTPSELTTKVTAECQAHNVKGDVVTIAFSVISRLYEQGCIMPWNDTMEQFDGFAPTEIDPAGAYHLYTQNPVGLIYNTQQVSDSSTLPKSLNDLSNSIWKGKLCIDDPSILNVAGDVFAGYSNNLSSSQWTSTLQSIASNNPTITQSASQTFTYVTSGQCAIGIDLASDYLGRGNATNLGFTWPFNPIPIQGGALGIVKGTSHPYTSMLVVEWFQSYAGQSATLASGRAPVLPTLLSIAFTGLTVPDYPRIALGGPLIVSNATYYKSTFTNIFGP
ncbi:MAG: extracellular solute-binding protein [Nitrososphaerota archaeon]|nr:extracellular solute-binding protein [Nitrososphaerota archaeon]